MSATVCVNCSRTLRQGWTFTFKTPRGQADKCLNCSLRHWPMLRRSLLTALVVGTILIILNHGGKLFSGSWAPALYLEGTPNLLCALPGHYMGGPYQQPQMRLKDCQSSLPSGSRGG